jgi:hypothetical protein
MTNTDQVPDNFSSLIAEQTDDDANDNPNVMVTGERFKDSKSIEAAEAAYLQSLLSDDDPDTSQAYPVPFLDSDGKCEPPDKTDAATLRERFGIEPHEFQELEDRS